MTTNLCASGSQSESWGKVPVAVADFPCTCARTHTHTQHPCGSGWLLRLDTCQHVMWQHVLFARNACCFRPSPLRAHAYASPFFFSLSLTGAVVSCPRNGCAGMLSLSASFPLFRYAPQIYPLVPCQCLHKRSMFTISAQCETQTCTEKRIHRFTEPPPLPRPRGIGEVSLHDIGVLEETPSQS